MQLVLTWKSGHNRIISNQPITMSRFLVLSVICVLLLQFSSIIASDSSLQTYIVRVSLPDNQVASDESFDLESYYQSFMPTTTDESSESRRIIFSYRHVFTGFAARLTADDVKEMSKKSGFISARPEEMFSLHTTHSPNFLGLHQGSGFWEQSNYGKGQIVCVLDTGFKSGHPSFDGAGIAAPPAKWKGTCDLAGACNNKLIGARSFVFGDASPEDTEGHGTHTASTAGGNYVTGANLFGLANGTAVGIAPLAHLAIYKVCGAQGCPGSAILGGMDAGIGDGCDVISMSLGGPSRRYDLDGIAIAAFSAIKKNIVVSCSAGNSGPGARTLSNEAPWILTVAASTIDRKLVSSPVLGNGQELIGQSPYQPSDWPDTQQFPLIYPTDTACTSALTNVEGKIVVCQSGGGITSVQKGRNVKAAGGVAMIYPNTELAGYTLFPPAYDIPAANINYEDAKKLLSYYKSSSSPTAALKFKGTVMGDKNAPAISYFSSRGPAITTPGILKPDITGPGVNILAAWPTSVENNPNTKKTFNIISGTSMSCPHLSGVVALIKSVHPTWSSAAIKSAIATTADTLNLDKKPILDQRHVPADLFATGAGHVNPAKASDPGLVYDIGPKDYLPYLCGLRYTSRQIKTITGETYSCSTSSIPEGQLNYPSFTVRRASSSTQTFTRTVTNVGGANEEYTVEVSPPSGVKVVVQPKTLTFTEANQKLTYTVTFTISVTSGTSQGEIIWKSADHSVRSPILAY